MDPDKTPTNSTMSSEHGGSMLLRFIYDTSSFQDRLVQHTVADRRATPGPDASKYVADNDPADAPPAAGSINRGVENPGKNETDKPLGK
ncbi:hypothetical protein FALBO_11006 [Fusarium albosuccineum]|uniref:Uncharacterized protein n=1 Tax=Fusarium albosuccineum TaxID=1237068 RepID=A0A8H4L500_9HYPO|nr:hypothetical protein FALBO_11006 [Fusarium albosuccineum]